MRPERRGESGAPGDWSRGQRRALISAAALALGLVGAELVVRVLDLTPPPLPTVEGRVFTQSGDARLRFENLPGSMQRITYRSSVGARAHVVEAHVNSRGLRGPEVELAKPPGGLRIACLGDSHTFGYGVAEGESWPDVLRQSLQADLGSQAIEVLNFGVNAFDTEQEVAQLELRVLDYSPDLVLIGFYLNDTALRGVAPDEQALPGFWVRLLDRRRGGWIAWLRKRSMLAELAADECYRRIVFDYYARSRSAGFAPDYPGWIRVQAALRRAQDLLGRRGVPVGLVLIPFLIRDEGELGSHAAFEVVQEFCASARLPCLDLEAEFEGLDVDSLRLHPQDYHATAQAHRIIGVRVADWLAERGWTGR